MKLDNNDVTLKNDSVEESRAKISSTSLATNSPHTKSFTSEEILLEMSASLTANGAICFADTRKSGSCKIDESKLIDFCKTMIHEGCSTGQSLSDFLHFFKLLRKTHSQIIVEDNFYPHEKNNFTLALNNAFDRLEIIFCDEWSKHTKWVNKDRIRVRIKNYLKRNAIPTSVFDGLTLPTIIMDEKIKITYINNPAVNLLFNSQKQDINLESLDNYKYPLWLKRPLYDFLNDNSNEGSYEYNREGTSLATIYRLDFCKFYDKKDCFSGVTLFIKNITEHHKNLNEKIMDEKVKTLNEMAGAICHEFNQPLQILTSIAEMMVNTSPLHEGYDMNMETIKGNIDRMAQLTSRLQTIEKYRTKGYLDSQIIDIEEASSLRKP